MAAVDDRMREDSVHSHLMNSVISNLNAETLSPEDVAWADSCLIKDADDSAADWSSIKDALLEIVYSQSEPQVNSSATQSSMQMTTADEIIRFHQHLKSMELGGGSDKDEDFIDDDFREVDSIDISEDDEDDIMFSNERSCRRGNVPGNVFRPNYSEDVKVEELDSGLNLSALEVESSLDDIFKVWDLSISEEQDEFTKQLDKALDEVPPVVTDTTAFKGMVNVSIDDLIAGLGDLSLKSTN